MRMRLEEKLLGEGKRWRQLVVGKVAVVTTVVRGGRDREIKWHGERGGGLPR